MTNAAELTRQGIAAHRAGDMASAATLFRQATEIDPAYEMAWLWRSSVAATDGERRSYLEAALRANPASEPAKRGLAQLGADVAAPPELAAPVAVPQVLPKGAGWACSACGGAVRQDATECKHCRASFGVFNLQSPAAGVPAAVAQAADRELLAYVIADYTRQGWRVVSQTDASVQLAEPKKLNPLGMAVFVMVPALIGCLAFLLAPGTGLLILGVAAIGLVLVVLDYALKKERLEFITAEQARQIVEQARTTGAR